MSKLNEKNASGGSFYNKVVENQNSLKAGATLKSSKSNISSMM